MPSLLYNQEFASSKARSNQHLDLSGKFVNKSLKFVPAFGLHRTRLTPRRLA
jgi:hypothetical protein